MRDTTQMAGMPGEEQARKAIAHVLQQCLNNPRLAYFIGPCSQSFDLLTEAHATLNGENHGDVQEAFTNPDAVGPDIKEEAEPAFPRERGFNCQAILRQMVVMPPVERLEFFDALRARYCLACGGYNAATVRECTCKGGAQ